jgi:hypothetical protein
MYILLDENNVVIQTQPNDQAGFVWTDENLICGQIRQGDGSYINPPAPDLTLEAAQVDLSLLYDAAMLTLQNGYSNEEVKTFAVKQDAIHEYVAGGVAGLSAENRSMIEALTGSTDDLVLAAKLDRMVLASLAFKNYLALIERARDIHILQLVDGVDNSAVVASLSAAYVALGG